MPKNMWVNSSVILLAVFCVIAPFYMLVYAEGTGKYQQTSAEMFTERMIRKNSYLMLLAFDEKKITEKLGNKKDEDKKE